MAKRKESGAAPMGNPATPIPEGLLYTREQLQTGMKPGLRPLIPAWHLVDGVIKLTYWHAVKYYSHTLMYAEKARMGCTFAEAREWVEGYIHFRNRRLEEVLKWLLEAYPPFIKDVDTKFPQYRPWEMVRNRTSECPMPPMLEEVGHGAVVPHVDEEVPYIKPYEMRPNDWYLSRAWVMGIYLGEPGPFFEFLRGEAKEMGDGIEHLKNIMSTGGGKTVHQIEPLCNQAIMMKADIDAFLLTYEA